MLNSNNTTSSLYTNLKGNQILSITFTSIIILIGSLGNFMNIFFIYKTPSLHSYNNILIAHLAAVDFLQVTLTLPMAIINSFLLSSNPHALCQAFAFILNLLITVSMAATAAISVDRCFAVVYPYLYSAKMKIKYIVIFVISTWFVMAILAGIPLFGLQRYGLGEYTFVADSLQCWFDFQYREKNKIAFIVTLAYVILILLITSISYLTIFYVACHKGITDISANGYASLVRSIRTTALIVGSNILCFIPVVLVSTISFISQRDLPVGLTITGYLMSFLNSAINPVIYAITNVTLRHKIKERLCWSSSWLQDPQAAVLQRSTKTNPVILIRSSQVSNGAINQLPELRC